MPATAITVDVVAVATVSTGITASPPPDVEPTVDVVAELDVTTTIAAGRRNYNIPRREVVWIHGLDGEVKGALGP